MALMPELTNRKLTQGAAVLLACAAATIEAVLPGNQAGDTARAVGGVASAVLGNTGHNIDRKTAIDQAVEQARKNPPTYSDQIERQYFRSYQEEVPRIEGETGLIGLGRKAVSTVFGAPKYAVTLGSSCLANTAQGDLFLAAQEGQADNRHGLQFDTQKGIMAIASAGNAPRLRFTMPDARPANQKTSQYLKKHDCPPGAYPHAPADAAITKTAITISLPDKNDINLAGDSSERTSLVLQPRR